MRLIMPIKPGKRLGPYTITNQLGAGGMGEVYQATDTRLDRSVAIKVLPEHLADDPERRQRFEREAKAVSSLNHPHICTLHDIGEQDGTHYLVMELVEGETLESRLTKGKLEVNRALEYALQIADALDKAHRKGVVHRDLKPSNIMLTATGVKLLDFGLAKLKGDSAPLATLSEATTQDKPLTAEGTIVGTLQYMSPERLEGEEADARSDIFSFGAIVYEMLAGNRAFQGKSAAALIASILTAEPPSFSRPDLPPAMEHLIRLCLAKKREDRWQTVHDVARQLEWILASLHTAPAPAPTAKRVSRTGLMIGLAALAVTVIVLFAVYFMRPVPAGQPMRFAVSLPEGVAFSVGEDFYRSAIISPDGQRIVFTGVDQKTGNSRLYVRAIDSANATPLEGTDEGNSIFWSPDSSSIGFVAAGKIQTVKVTGGAPRQIVESAGNAGATWSKNDVILASLKNPGPIFKLSASGGAPSQATSLDPAMEIDHQWPQFLDDGDHFLYLATGRTTAANKVYAASLTSQSRSLVVDGVAAFAYASPNHLIFLKNGTLFAQAFDTDKFELAGTPISLAENALPPFSASRTGAVTYRTNPPTPLPLLWIRTDGSLLGTALPPGYYTDPVISPDGNAVAFASREKIEEPWHVSILNLANSTTRILTVGDGVARSPVWSPDGKTIAFLSLRRDAPGMYRKNANGVGAEELLLPFPGGLWPYQWPGDQLQYFAGSSGAFDIWMMSPDNPQGRTALIQTSANEVDGAVSPDGKWFVYSSNETGRWEVYVTTFPPSATKLPVTTHGGTDPLWGRDGKTLFYVRASNADLLSVPVTPGNPPQFGSPVRIHAGPLEYPSGHSFAVHPREDRLLIAPSSAPRGDITVLLNWKSLPVN